MISFLKRKFHNLVSDKKFSEILRGSVWSLGARIIATVLAMITSIITARIYGAEIIPDIQERLIESGDLDDRERRSLEQLLRRLE